MLRVPPTKGLQKVTTKDIIPTSAAATRDISPHIVIAASSRCSDSNSNPIQQPTTDSVQQRFVHLQQQASATVQRSVEDDTRINSNSWPRPKRSLMESLVQPKRAHQKATCGVQTEESSFFRDPRCPRHRVQQRESDRSAGDDHQDVKGKSSKHQKQDSCGHHHKSAFKQLRGLSNVTFPKWAKLNKKPNLMLELMENYLGSLYKPFAGVRKQLDQQAKDVLIHRCLEDYQTFEEQYLRPLAIHLCQVKVLDDSIPSIARQKHRRSKKKTGWPLCARGCLILHLAELDPKLIRDGDFYFVCDEQAIHLVYQDSGQLYQRSLNARQFCLLMAQLVCPKDRTPDDQPPGDEDEDEETEERKLEKDLTKVLSHLLVSVERGIQRIELAHVSRDLWRWDISKRNRRHQRSTRDSWVQTTSPTEDVNRDLETGSGSKNETMAPLASEEEFSSDTELKQRTEQKKAADETQIPTQCVGSIEDLSQAYLLNEPSAIGDFDDTLFLSQIAVLPGCRDLCGRSVVYLFLGQLRKFPNITPLQLAQLIFYFQNIPKRDVMRLGFLVIVDGREATAQECHVMEQALALIEARAPRTVSVVLTWQKQNQKPPIVPPTSILHRGHIRFETITNVNQLLKYVRRNQLLPEFGGLYIYDHEGFIEFQKCLEPLTNGCRQTGHHLLSVMQELRSQQLPSSSSLSCQMIQHHKKQIMDALEDENLRRLEADGDTFLAELEAQQKKSPQNQDYKESVEKCRLLYNQLKKILQQLTKLADKRLGRLQECMMLKTFEEESSQVLSWLSHNGNETLKRHKVLAKNASAIKEQENEFEKFYFLAMRQIERGNDLLDEAPQPRVVSDATVHGVASVLKNQLDEFTEHLEEARERLEDTSRCYNMLDKSYEWALDTMRFVSCMNMNSISTDAVNETLKQLEEYLQDHPPFSEETFEQMTSIATKLSNEQLSEQCQMAHKRCLETQDLIQNRLSTLQKNKEQLEENGLCRPNENVFSKNNPYVWMPVISSTPYRNSSQSFLHGSGSLYGSQQILREPTGSYTSFPSSYYPATGLKEIRKDFLLKNGLESERNSRCAMDAVNYTPVSRKSYPFCGTLNSFHSNGSKETLNDSVSSGSTGKRNPKLKHLNSDISWKKCQDALKKATEEVREQNCRLQLQQINEGLVHNDSMSDSKVEAPRRPAPVNMHLLRCASCSDFEELLSSQNAELEAEKKAKKILKLTMKEMIQTERDYVKSLEYIIENYIPLLQKTDIPQVLRGQRNVLFGNIEKIYEFHNFYFLQELEQCENMPYSVGQCFLKFEPQFYLYALYNKNKPKSDDLMAEFGSSFFRKKQLELGDKMDLASYLLKPVQRMGKYALLLKQLLKECPERDSDYTNLKAAEEMVHFQLRHGNDLLAMDTLQDCDVNVKEQGRLLRQEEFLVWQGKSRKALRRVFLFEDLILLSKARRDPECKGHDFYQYKHSIKTTDIGLTEQVGDSPTKFEIWFRKRKVQDIYTLQAPSAEVKKAWVQDISKLLWKQALRNRELRLAEMTSMGIGNKPCLDITPSQDQICDRSISLQQLNKAPRFRNSIALSSCDNYNSNRPHSLISVDSNSSAASTSSSSSSSSSAAVGVPEALLEDEEKEIRRLSVTQQSQCSAESGIFTDASMSGDSFLENDFLERKTVERSDSILSQTSLVTVGVAESVTGLIDAIN